VDDVKWLAGIGADFGAITVRADAPWKNLKELMAAIKADPAKVVFAAGGTIGSQDWMKSALIAKEANINYKKMRYVAFEGGGEALTALLGGHVQVVSGDASEVENQLEGGKIRVLAVLSDERLTGKLKDVPTAKEQGYDITWPIIRGFYMGPKVSDADYQYWVDAFNKMLATPEFAKLRAERGLYPYAKTGPALDTYVKQQVKQYRDLAAEFGLVKQ
jgi:putative tricarboxylic transport membrane protein